MDDSRKEFHFDLDENFLKEHYVPKRGGENAWRSAWGDIRKFMEAHGFEHSQYSGYESINPMGYEEAYAVLDALRYEFPWFAECAQVATLTEIGERHDVLQHFSQHVIDTAAPVPVQHTVSLHGQEADMRRSARALEGGQMEPQQRGKEDLEK